MQTEPTVDRAAAPQSTLVIAAVVPQLDASSAARRASDRRATARAHKGDIDGRIFGYVKDHSRRPSTATSQTLLRHSAAASPALPKTLTLMKTTSRPRPRPVPSRPVDGQTQLADLHVLRDRLEDRVLRQLGAASPARNCLRGP